MLRPLALLLLIAFGLSACASAEVKALRKTPDYRAGYDDGCASATAAGTNYRGGQIRSEDAYAANKAYRVGWNSGYSACRRTDSAGAAHDNPLQVGPGH